MTSESLNWEDFKDAMLRRLQVMAVSNVFEVLLGMKREGTVKEYTRKF